MTLTAGAIAAVEDHIFVAQCDSNGGEASSARSNSGAPALPVQNKDQLNCKYLRDLAVLFGPVQACKLFVF